MQPVRHSKSGNKQEWGYDEVGHRAYVIFGGPGKPIALYEYSNVPPTVADAVRSSSDDSQTLTDLLVEGPHEYAKLYPTT
jgi:hypothetical protein